MDSWKTRVYIGNSCFAVGSKCAGQNQSCGRSCEHKSGDFPDQLVPETDLFTEFVIFVSGTSGITVILTYRSVNPIISTTGTSIILLLQSDTSDSPIVYESRYLVTQPHLRPAKSIKTYSKSSRFAAAGTIKQLCLHV